MTCNLTAVARNGRLVALAQLAILRSGERPDRISRLRRPVDAKTVDVVFASVRARQPEVKAPILRIAA